MLSVSRKLDGSRIISLDNHMKISEEDQNQFQDTLLVLDMGQFAVYYPRAVSALNSSNVSTACHRRSASNNSPKMDDSAPNKL